MSRNKKIKTSKSKKHKKKLFHFDSPPSTPRALFVSSSPPIETTTPSNPTPAQPPTTTADAPLEPFKSAFECEVEDVYNKANQAEVIFDKYRNKVSLVVLGLEQKIGLFAKLFPVSPAIQKLITAIVLFFIYVFILLPLLSGLLKLSLPDVGVVLFSLIVIFVLNFVKSKVLT